MLWLFFSFLIFSSHLHKGFAAREHLKEYARLRDNTGTFHERTAFKHGEKMETKLSVLLISLPLIVLVLIHFFDMEERDARSFSSLIARDGITATRRDNQLIISSGGIVMKGHVDGFGESEAGSVSKDALDAFVTDASNLSNAVMLSSEDFPIAPAVSDTKTPVTISQVLYQYFEGIENFEKKAFAAYTGIRDLIRPSASPSRPSMPIADLIPGSSPQTILRSTDTDGNPEGFIPEVSKEGNESTRLYIVGSLVICIGLYFLAKWLK